MYICTSMNMELNALRSVVKFSKDSSCATLSSRTYFREVYIIWQFLSDPVYSEWRTIIKKMIVRHFCLLFRGKKCIGEGVGYSVWKGQTCSCDTCIQKWTVPDRNSSGVVTVTQLFFNSQYFLLCFRICLVWLIPYCCIPYLSKQLLCLWQRPTFELTPFIFCDTYAVKLVLVVICFKQTLAFKGHFFVIPS